MFRILCDPSLGGVGCEKECQICKVYRTNLTFLFILQSKKSRCQTPTTHTKISQVISGKHVQHSLTMDHKGSETCRSF